MALFVDTSALYAALDADDNNHQAAVKFWQELSGTIDTAWTTNYVLVETAAVAGRRLGLQAVRDFHTRFVPLLRVHWVNESLHQQGMAALLTAARRDLSLVDCISFEVMRRLALDTAFTFDAHFAQQGYTCVPS